MEREDRPDVLPENTGNLAKKPYCCPVCAGRGQVPAHFYWFSTSGGSTTSCFLPVSCRSCGSSGIVWR